MKKLLSLVLLGFITIGITACSNDTTEDKDVNDDKVVAEKEVKEFGTEYEVDGTTSSGKPKNDTFIFKGETTDGVITSLEFDIVRNKGLEDEYSKTDIMGYMMNVSDIDLEVGEKNTTLKIDSYGYDPEYAEGASAQYGVSASTDELTKETKFEDLTFNDAFGDMEITIDKAILAFKSLAMEKDIVLTKETAVVELVSVFGLYENDELTSGKKRVSFEGIAGGRSYGEQINSIKEYILKQGMTLEEVYEMFKTVNQADEPVEERDTVAGATITFVGDFQRMVYLAMHGELFEGVVNSTTKDDITTVEVVTQGYGGEIETYVSFDLDKRIVDVIIRDHNETDGIGADIVVEGSDFLKDILENGSEADTVSGATKTSSAIKKAVEYAVEYINKLA